MLVDFGCSAVGGVFAVGMDHERVHDRQRPSALAIRGAEVAQEPGRRMGLPRGVGPVGATWRDRSADHVDRLRDCLQRVVRPGQKRLVGRGGKVAASAVELRHPEPV